MEGQECPLASEPFTGGICVRTDPLFLVPTPAASERPGSALHVCFPWVEGLQSHTLGLSGDRVPCRPSSSLNLPS